MSMYDRLLTGRLIVWCSLCQSVRCDSAFRHLIVDVRFVRVKMNEPIFFWSFCMFVYSLVATQNTAYFVAWVSMVYCYDSASDVSTCVRVCSSR